MTTVHVVRKVVWDVVIEDDSEDAKLLGISHRTWQHDTEQSAVERADRLVSKQLFDKRGKDKL